MLDNIEIKLNKTNIQTVEFLSMIYISMYKLIINSGPQSRLSLEIILRLFHELISLHDFNKLKPVIISSYTHLEYLHQSIVHRYQKVNSGQNYKKKLLRSAEEKCNIVMSHVERYYRPPQKDNEININAISQIKFI